MPSKSAAFAVSTPQPVWVNNPHQLPVTANDVNEAPWLVKQDVAQTLLLIVTAPIASVPEPAAIVFPTSTRGPSRLWSKT